MVNNKNRIGKLILKLLGWKIIPFDFQNVKKFVIIEAPHTSNWDFILGRLALNSYNITAKFVIKKELFFFPLNILLKKLGAIPVNRHSPNSVLEQIVDLYNQNDRLAIIITPEGTRKLTKNWKRGFYYIAQKAKVPIVIGYMDYKKKEIGFDDIFYPTGDYNKDLKVIQSYYKDKTAKYPENFFISK